MCTQVLYPIPFFSVIASRSNHCQSYGNGYAHRVGLGFPTTVASSTPLACMQVLCILGVGVVCILASRSPKSPRSRPPPGDTDTHRKRESKQPAPFFVPSLSKPPFSDIFFSFCAGGEKAHGALSTYSTGAQPARFDLLLPPSPSSQKEAKSLCRY